MNRIFLLVALAALSLSACGAGESGVVDKAAYLASVEEWRANRLARLKAKGGYLNQVGLFWLDEGRSRFGGSDDNDIVFPGAADAALGEFELAADGVTMIVNEGIEIRSDGVPVKRLSMPDDTLGEPLTASYGSLAWNVIRRQGKFGIRLRDFEHPVLQSFPGIPHYEVQPSWRVEALLRPFAEPKTMDVGTVIEGLGYNPISPGIVEFELNGKRYELEAYESGDELFFVFGDLTSGNDTYPAGRFLYAELPNADGKTVMDFNQAYNPPCAFNDFSTCPVAAPQNRLSVAVEAGEKYVASLYHGSTEH